MNLLKTFFDIKHNERKLVDLQIASLKVYIDQMEAEKELIQAENPEVQSYLIKEFEFQRAMNMLADRYADLGIRVNYRPPSTESTVRMARLYTKVCTGIKE